MREAGSKGQEDALRSALIRYFSPLPKGASKSVRLSWSRRVALKLGLPTLAVMVVAVIVINTTWLYALAGVLIVLWAWGLAGLSRDIRRARRAEHAG